MFSGLLVGAVLPYWFSAMTMKSVGKAALAMVQEVRRQFATIPGIMDGSARPDYRQCVEISTAVCGACPPFLLSGLGRPHGGLSVRLLRQGLGLSVLSSGFHAQWCSHHSRRLIQGRVCVGHAPSLRAHTTISQP